MKKFLASAAILTMVPLSLVATTATAANAANVPSCVKVKVTNNPTSTSDTAKVTNNCSTTKKVKVIWKRGPDESCKTLKKGQSVTERAANVFASYDKTVTC